MLSTLLISIISMFFDGDSIGRQFSEGIMSTSITASMLYNFAQCPHRVTMDLFADPAIKDRISPFVQLLWERGSLYEEQVIEGLSLPFADLSRYAGEEKEQQTLEAMNHKDR